MTMINDEYANTWVNGLDAGVPNPGGSPAARPMPVPSDVNAYADAWHDGESGPLEKAVRAAGTVPAVAAPADETDRKAKP